MIYPILKKTVQTIEPNAGIVAAARKMRDHHLGDLIVVNAEKNTPLGILTDRDIVVGLVALGVDYNHVTVADVMSYDVRTANLNDNMSDVTEMMSAYGLQRVPVVDDDGVLQGIFTVEDALQTLSMELEKLAALRPASIKNERAQRPLFEDS